MCFARNLKLDNLTKKKNATFSFPCPKNKNKKIVLLFLFFFREISGTNFILNVIFKIKKKSFI